MTAVLIIVTLIALFVVLVFALADRETSGSERRTPPSARDRRTSSTRIHPDLQPSPEPDKVKKIGGDLFAELLAGVLLVLTLLIGASALNRAWLLNLAHRSASFPTVTGEIVSAQVTRVSGYRSRTIGWEPVVSYRYVVDGLEYTGSAWRIHPSFVEEQRAAEEIVAGYPPRAQVNVFYDPSEPERATLRSGSVGWFDYVGATVTLTLIVGSLVFGLYVLASLHSRVPIADGDQDLRAILGRLVRRMPQPPRMVEACELIPTLYRPRLHAICIVAAASMASLIVAPLLILPYAWALVGFAVLGLGVVVIAPLSRLMSVLWAARHGVDSSARITEYSFVSTRSGMEAQVCWRIHGPQGEFVGRYTLRGKGYEKLHKGSAVRVLVHPTRPKVLQVIDLHIPPSG